MKQHSRFGSYAAKMGDQTLNTRSVDDKKVTDHHAILITENTPKELTSDEQTIYEMVTGRMLEAFSFKCVSHFLLYFCKRKHLPNYAGK